MQRQAAAHRAAATRDQERPQWRRRATEAVLVVGLILAAALVRQPWHPHGPFWIDEAWVADSLRAPLRQLRALAGPTPLGWLALLRLVPPVGGAERYRIVPVVFALAAVVPAYFLARRAAPPSTPAWVALLPAVVAGLAVGLLPAAVGRPFLKPYTCEMLVTLVLVVLLARAEAVFSRARLAVLAAACVPAALLSNTSLFVSAAAVAALGLRVLLRAEWRRLPSVLAVATVVAAVDAAALVWLLTARGNPTLIRYWASAGTFLPIHKGLDAAATVARHRLAAVLGGGVGFGPWPVVVVLTAAGMVAFWRAGFPAVGLVLPLVALELVVAGAIRLFPFAEARTSLFAIGLVALLAGTGAGTAAVQLLRRGWIAPLGVAVGLTVLALLISAAVRASPGRVPRELIPQQLAHIQAERRPGDIVLISANASWQFAYYAPDRPTFVTTSRRWTAMHFTVTYPGRSDLIVVDGLDAVAIRRALAIAAARARRIWIVLGHSEPGRGEEAILDKEARSIGRVTRAPTRIVEPFRRRRLELQRPWLVEVTASVAP